MKVIKKVNLGIQLLVFLFSYLMMGDAIAQEDIPNSMYLHRMLNTGHGNKEIGLRRTGEINEIKLGYIHNPEIKTNVRTYYTKLLSNVESPKQEAYLQTLGGFSIGPYSTDVANSFSWFELNDTQAFFRHSMGIGTNPSKGALHVQGSMHVESTELDPNTSEPYSVFHVTAGDHANDNKGRVFIGDNAYTTFENLRDNNQYQDSKILTENFRLWVSQGIVSEDIVLINKDTWADYVFRKDYQLTALDELETFIKKNGHLPNIPSEEEVRSDGYSIHEIATSYLEKIEELTLHTIAQEKKINRLEKLVGRLTELVESDK